MQAILGPTDLGIVLAHLPGSLMDLEKVSKLVPKVNQGLEQLFSEWIIKE
jgi:hypothetical protein